MVTERRRGRGRPPKPAEEVKRHSLGVRTTKELKSKLEAAAALSGRSFAQEVELRLEKSFEGPDHISVPLGLLRTLIEAAELQSQQKWNEDYVTWIAAHKAARHVMEMFAPEIPNRTALLDAQTEYAKEAAKWTEAIPEFGVPSLPKSLTREGSALQNFLGLDLHSLNKRRERLEGLRTAADDASAMARDAVDQGKVLFDEIADQHRLAPKKG